MRERVVRLDNNLAKRFFDITGIDKPERKQIKEGMPYRFFEADEDKDSVVDPGVTSTDPEMDMLNEPKDPAIDKPEQTPDGVNPMMGGDPNAQMPDQGAAPTEPSMEDPMVVASAGMVDDTQEIDITDLVNTSRETKEKVFNLSQSIEKITGALENVLKASSGISQKIDQSLGSMSMELNGIKDQVNLMRPPTQNEMIKATREKSYPFTLSADDIKNKVGAQTQTDAEDLSKMSVDDLTNHLRGSFDIGKIRDSFNIPNTDKLEGFK